MINLWMKSINWVSTGAELVPKLQLLVSAGGATWKGHSRKALGLEGPLQSLLSHLWKPQGWLCQVSLWVCLNGARGSLQESVLWSMRCRIQLSVLPKEEQVYPCPQNSREILPVSCVIVVIERIEVFWVWK